MPNNATSIKNNDRHWLRFGPKSEWEPVSKKRYDAAFQEAGFDLFDGGNSGNLGTGCFGNGSVQGRITGKKVSYDEYKDDPEFLDALVKADKAREDIEE